MFFEWLFLILCAVLVILLLIFRKTYVVKKYWRYALILAPFVIVVVIQVMLKVKGKSSDPSKPDPLIQQMDNLKSNLQEADMVTTIEVTAAKTNDVATLNKLQQVRQIADPEERTRQLAAMVG
jgi:glucan phosphoethanolaminetransferase (alkaline phosphatase superfamily)